MKDGLVPSSFGPQKNKEITREQFDKIKKELGVEALIIITEDKSNECDGKSCLGHFTFFRAEGFNPHNIAGIGNTMMDYADEISTSNKLNP